MNEKKKGLLDRFVDGFIHHTFGKTGFVETHTPKFIKKAVNDWFESAFELSDKKK